QQENLRKSRFQATRSRPTVHIIGNHADAVLKLSVQHFGRSGDRGKQRDYHQRKPGIRHLYLEVERQATAGYCRYPYRWPFFGNKHRGADSRTASGNLRKRDAVESGSIVKRVFVDRAWNKGQKYLLMGIDI